MSFRLVKLLLLICVVYASGCASGSEIVPETLQNQIDSSVPFLKIRENPEKYQNTVVILGGEILSSRRLQDGTHLEVLQLPLDDWNEPVHDRTTSQGRFLALESSFLDPATLPPNTRITLVGKVSGVKKANLDDMEYSYPTLTLKHLHVWPELELEHEEPSGPSFGIFGGGSRGGRVGGGVSIGIGF